MAWLCRGPLPSKMGSICPGVFAPHIGKIYNPYCSKFTTLSWFLNSPTGECVRPIFTLNRPTSNDVCCSQFCLWIRTVSCHGNRGRHGTNLNNTVGKPGPKNREVRANSAQFSFTGTELYRFELFIGCNAKFCNFWMVAMARGVVRGYI